MKTAAIIGGGVIGGGWAARFLLNGWDVSVFDPDPEAERKIAEVLAQARWALPMLYDRALPAEGRLAVVSTRCEASERTSRIAMRRVCDASGLRCVGSAMRRVCDATRSRPVGDHAPPSHSRDGGALA